MAGVGRRGTRPTLSGTLILAVNSPIAPCDGPDSGCSIAPGDGIGSGAALAETFVYSNPDGLSTSQDTFCWELGHQFDWAYLTAAERQQFAAIWDSTLPWWDSIQSLEHGQEDGLEAEFALDYADCAIDQNWQISWVPQIDMAQLEKTCALISQIGTKVGATPASSPTIYQVPTAKKQSKKHRKAKTRPFHRAHRAPGIMGTGLRRFE